MSTSSRLRQAIEGLQEWAELESVTGHMTCEELGHVQDLLAMAGLDPSGSAAVHVAYELEDGEGVCRCGRWLTAVEISRIVDSVG